MPTNSRIVIPPQTAAVTTEATFESRHNGLPVFVSAPGLAGAETVGVFYSVDGGTTWTAYFSAGSALTLTATAPHMKIDHPGIFGFTKASTVALVGVYVNVGA